MATSKIQTGIRFEPELLSKITKIAKKTSARSMPILNFLRRTALTNLNAKTVKFLLTKTSSIQNDKIKGPCH